MWVFSVYMLVCTSEVLSLSFKLRLNVEKKEWKKSREDATSRLLIPSFPSPFFFCLFTPSVALAFPFLIGGGRV